MPQPVEVIWWRARAACVTAPLPLVDAAFTRAGSPEGKRFIADYCQRCEVWQQCLDEAMKTGERGVWGGTSLRGRTMAGGTKVTNSSTRPERDPNIVRR